MGKQGIRLLARIVRDSVYTKLVTSRSYSSTLNYQSRDLGPQGVYLDDDIKK